MGLRSTKVMSLMELAYYFKTIGLGTAMGQAAERDTARMRTDQERPARECKNKSRKPENRMLPRIHGEGLSIASFCVAFV